MLFSFLFFIASVLIGVFSQWQDPDFANLILGPGYVNMTVENIEKGDPMAVYKDSDEAPMLFFISSNNLKVDIFTFISGIFGCLGTLYIILQNGIMVGVFQYFFIERGLFFESATTIWLHGTLEMSAMIIAGGAGLILGCSLLFPGSYRRIDSLMRGGMDALKIIIALLPVTMVAAIIESYLTRYTDMPDYVNLTVIVLSGLFIIWYFFYYPFRVHKKMNKITDGED